MTENMELVFVDINESRPNSDHISEHIPDAIVDDIGVINTEVKELFIPPPGSGYDITTKKSIKVENITDEKTKIEYQKRITAWNQIQKCPLCTSTQLFKYYNVGTDRYHVICYAVPTYVYKELEALCRGIYYEAPVRLKNSGTVPLSHKVKSIEEYTEAIQEKLCSWSISL